MSSLPQNNYHMNLNYTTQTIQHLSIPQALDNIKHDLISRTIGRFLGWFEIKVQPIYIECTVWLLKMKCEP